MTRALDKALDEFKAAGASVVTGDAVPPDKRRRLAEMEEEFRDLDLLKSRKPVPLWRIHSPRRFVYQDERCTIIIPIPRLDVFAAFYEEMARLPDAMEQEDADEILIDTLARAFVILWQRPRWWQRNWIPEFVINTERAREFLMRKLPTDVILASLPKAYVAFYAYVTGREAVAEDVKKKTEVTRV